MKSTSLLAMSAVAISLGVFGCSRPPEMRVNATTVHAGEPILVRFEKPLSMKAADKKWLTLVPAGAEPSAVGERVLLSERDLQYRLSTQDPGAYELRLHRGYPARDHALMRSVPITVTAPGS